MPLTPFLSTPVLIDPTSTAATGSIGGVGAGPGIATTYTPFFYGGALYQVVQANVPDSGNRGFIYVYRSIDGNTWAPLDAANGPYRTNMPAGTAGFLFDGDHTVIVAFQPTGTGGDAAEAIALKNFDLSTGTWGTAYGTIGAPTPWFVGPCFLRPDGSIVVLGATTVPGVTGASITAYVYTSGTWTGYPVDSNLQSGWVAMYGLGCIMEPASGNIHIFDLALQPTIPSTDDLEEIWYQLFRADNSLGTFAVIQSPPLPYYADKSGWFMQPAIVGDNVMVGLVDFQTPPTNFCATIAVGTPLSAPAFTILAAPGVDPTPPVSGLYNKFFGPALTVDATGIYAAYLIQANDQSYTARLAFSPNLSAPLTGWNTSILAFDSNDPGALAVASPTNWMALGIQQTPYGLFASASAVSVIGFNPFAPAYNTQFWLGNFTPPPPIQPYKQAIGGGGAARCIPPPRPPQPKCFMDERPETPESEELVMLQSVFRHGRL